MTLISGSNSLGLISYQNRQARVNCHGRKLTFADGSKQRVLHITPQMLEKKPTNPKRSAKVPSGLAMNRFILYYMKDCLLVYH